MPVFKCSQCGVMENTATSNYVMRTMIGKKPPLCSQCDPAIGRWHGRFERKKPKDKGLVIGPDGYVYHPEDPYYIALREADAKR